MSQIAKEEKFDTWKMLEKIEKVEGIASLFEGVRSVLGVMVFIGIFVVDESTILPLIILIGLFFLFSLVGFLFRDVSNQMRDKYWYKEEEACKKNPVMFFITSTSIILMIIYGISTI